MQCPHCKRSISAVPGAARIQCFGCGKVIDLSGSFSRAKKSAAKRGDAPAVSSAGETTGNTAKKAILAIAFISLGLVILVGVGTGAFLFLLDRKSASQNPGVVESTSEPVAQSEIVAAGGAEGLGDKAEELVPAYVASQEERKIASRVSSAHRRQIIQMWDELTQTTMKKLLIPKNSYTRNSVENMLGMIEQREIKTMSALLQIEEHEILAVIQVEMADRAEEELRQSAANR